MGSSINQTVALALTNKSGENMVRGDVVIVDSNSNEAFKAASGTAQATDTVGVVLDGGGIANNLQGMVAIGGYVSVINLSSAASLGDSFGVSSTSKKAVPHATVQTGDFGQVLSPGTTPSAVLWGTVNQGVSTGSAPATSGIPTDGWVDAGVTWTYASADAPSYTFTVGSNVTGTYFAGYRVKFTQTTIRYAIITKVTFSAGTTTITIYGGTDYVLDNAAITSPYYSPVKSPYGFPTDPAKWTVRVVSSTEIIRNSPTNDVWYNIGSGTILSISVPIGVWELRYQTTLDASKASTTQIDMFATLSTGTSSEIDNELTSVSFITGATGAIRIIDSKARQKKITITDKTTYNLLGKTSTASITYIDFRGDLNKTIIEAVCLLL
jgi:hypothetical protein